MTSISYKTRFKHTIDHLEVLDCISSTANTCSGIHAVAYTTFLSYWCALVPYIIVDKLISE